MQYYLLWILALPFLYINYKIVLSDIKIKKIPNKYLKYLLLLLPFWWLFLLLRPVSWLDIWISETGLLFFFLQVILTLIISFILYNFWIWSAWDAKYLLVLGLFIPHIWIIPFIWNIALLTVWYLFLYFIWFYIWKCLFNWKYSKSLYWNIYNDLKEKLITFLKSWDGNFYKKIVFFRLFKWLVTFLVIFVSLRISRIYIFKDIFENKEKSEWFLDLLQNYHIYLFIAFVWFFIWFLIWFRWLYWKIKNYTIKKSQINWDYIDLFFLSILFLILCSFLVYEYFIDSGVLIKSLYMIFSLYLSIFIIFLILRYSYKITFSIAETYYIDVKDLKEGDIVDKEYLVKMFWKQASLWYLETKEEEKIKKNKLLYPNPTEYFQKIENPIDKETLKKLNKIYKIVNKYHLKNNINHSTNTNIKILLTFAFWWYIFFWIIITFLLWNDIFKFIIDIWIDFIKNIYN